MPRTIRQQGVPLVRDKSTAESRAFWDAVRESASALEGKPDWVRAGITLMDEDEEMTTRSLTMTADEAFGMYEAGTDLYADEIEGALAVARETERRLLAKLRALPTSKFQLCWHDDVANEIRDALLAAVEEGE